MPQLAQGVLPLSLAGAGGAPACWSAPACPRGPGLLSRGGRAETTLDQVGKPPCGFLPRMGVLAAKIKLYFYAVSKHDHRVEHVVDVAPADISLLDICCQTLPGQTLEVLLHLRIPTQLVYTSGPANLLGGNSPWPVTAVPVKIHDFLGHVAEVLVLVQAVEETVSLMRVRAIEKGLSLDARYEFPLSEGILSDPARLRQILINLTGNALKFTAQGRVEIVVRCATDIQAGRAMLAFDVKDSGVGMTDEQIGRLFQPFVQANSSTTREFGGTGLGLAISKKLAEALGGDIQVTSRPGEGSTFTFTMEAELTTPARIVNDLSDMTPHVPHESRSTCQTVAKLRGRILLAEDGPDNQRLISTILRKAGAEVDLADNGRIAVDMVLAAMSGDSGKKPYDVILMDMQMPEMDGYQATAKLRQSGCKGPIIALTAHAMAGDRAKCIAAGCDDYTTKPIDRTALLSVLARLMGSRELGPPEEESPAAAPQADSVGAVYSDYRDDADMAGIIAEFVAHLPQRVKEMRQAAANNQWDALQRAAHQLKGSGGGYGYACLTEVARGLESQAKRQDAEAAMLTLNDLAVLVERILAGREGQPASQTTVHQGGNARKI